MEVVTQVAELLACILIAGMAVTISHDRYKRRAPAIARSFVHGSPCEAVGHGPRGHNRP